jgi:hypothetical protein
MHEQGEGKDNANHIIHVSTFIPVRHSRYNFRHLDLRDMRNTMLHMLHMWHITRQVKRVSSFIYHSYNLNGHRIYDNGIPGGIAVKTPDIFRA